MSAIPESAGGQSVFACSIATVILAGLTVILRFIARGAIKHVLGPEDWCILAAVMFSVGNTVCMVIQAQHAIGRHFVDVSMYDLTEFLKAAFLAIIFYNISLTLTKISIVLLYLRLFQGTERRWIFTVLGMVILYGLWVFCVSTFNCNPISAAWDLTAVNPRCLPKAPIWFTNASLNIITDFAIFLLPIPVIKKLNLPKRHKIGVVGVFAVGFFICIVSIMRLYSLYIAATSTDPTWDNIGIANWSCIELNTSILCACLPTLKPILSFIFPRLLSSSEEGQNGYLRQSEGVDAHPPTIGSEESEYSKAKRGVLGSGNESQRVITNPSRTSLELHDLENNR